MDRRQEIDCSKVVIVEDDIDIREIVTEALELEGYTVLACSNGAEALEQLQQTITPCLILLDLMMPVMDGETFLEARKSLGETIRSIPVFLVSAVADKRKADETGANGYMKKPVELDSLVQLVKDHCQAVQTNWDDEKHGNARPWTKQPPRDSAHYQFRA